MAITWRNIDAPNLGQAGQLLGLSNELVNQGANQLTDVMNARLQTQKQVWDAQKNQNTQNAINAIRGMNTDQLAQSNIAGLLAPYGAQVDAQQVRDAFNGQDEFIAGNLQTAQNIKDANDRTQYGGTYDTFLQALAQGDLKTAQGLATQLKGTVFGVDAANAYTTASNTAFDHNIATRRLAMEGQANALAAQRLKMDRDNVDRQLADEKRQRQAMVQAQQVVNDALARGEDPILALNRNAKNINPLDIASYNAAGQQAAARSVMTPRQKEIYDMTVGKDIKTAQTRLTTEKDNALKTEREAYGLSADIVDALDNHNVDINKFIGNGEKQIPQTRYDELVRVMEERKLPGVENNELAALALRFDNGNGKFWNGKSWYEVDRSTSADEMADQLEQMRAGYMQYATTRKEINTNYNTQNELLNNSATKLQWGIGQTNLMDLTPEQIKTEQDKISKELSTLAKGSHIVYTPTVDTKAEAKKDKKTIDNLTKIIEQQNAKLAVGSGPVIQNSQIAGAPNFISVPSSAPLDKIIATQKAAARLANAQQAMAAANKYKSTSAAMKAKVIKELQDAQKSYDSLTSN